MLSLSKLQSHFDRLAMKILAVIFLLSYILLVVTAKRDLIRRRDQRLWCDFKRKFGKKYASSTEEQEHCRVFLENAREVRQHNRAFAKGRVTYKKALNLFSDQCDKDIIKKLSGLMIGKISDENKEKPIVGNAVENLPSYNGCWPEWPVRNQQTCSSCWAFSAIGSIEATYYKKTGTLLDLSEQQLVDCVYNRDGCGGGFMPNAYDYLKNNNGTINETLYPYVSRYGNCSASGKERSVKLSSGNSYYQVAPDDASIKQKIIENGPLAATVDCNDYLKYGGGVYSSTRTFTMNHAGILCGWGTLNGTQYWILRNSWSSFWGLKGHIWLSAERILNSSVTKGGLFTQNLFYPVVLS